MSEPLTREEEITCLKLAREARAWYFGQTAYATEHFGNTGGLTGDDNYGYCVEIALPEEET